MRILVYIVAEGLACLRAVAYVPLALKETFRDNNHVAGLERDVCCRITAPLEVRKTNRNLASTAVLLAQNHRTIPISLTREPARFDNGIQKCNAATIGDRCR